MPQYPISLHFSSMTCKKWNCHDNVDMKWGRSLEITKGHFIFYSLEIMLEIPTTCTSAGLVLVYTPSAIEDYAWIKIPIPIQILVLQAVT